MVTLAAAIADTLVRRDTDTPIRSLAAAIFRGLPTFYRTRLDANIMRTGNLDTEVTQVLQSGATVDRHSATTIVSRLAAEVARTLPVEESHDEHVNLHYLLRAALYNPVLDVRVFTGMFLAASPYRTAVAKSLADNLRHTAITQPTHATAALTLLRSIGGREERRKIEQLILADALPSTVRTAALHALGHLGGQSHTEFWLAALGRVLHHEQAQKHTTYQDTLRLILCRRRRPGKNSTPRLGSRFQATRGSPRVSRLVAEPTEATLTYHLQLRSG
jgi:hypothetical protein